MSFTVVWEAQWGPLPSLADVTPNSDGITACCLDLPHYSFGLLDVQAIICALSISKVR